jgi:hypothetical protein
MTLWRPTVEACGVDVDAEVVCDHCFTRQWAAELETAPIGAAAEILMNRCLDRESCLFRQGRLKL